jgi:ribonuclease HI
MHTIIYTDGSSRGNPGPGGWAAVVIMGNKEDGMVMELGGREVPTTNNRMELMGAIMGLREVEGKSGVHVEVCTDSQYVKKGISEWITGWIRNGWKSSTKKPVLNQDLWQALKKEEDRITSSGGTVVWKYVPGHAGVAMNERADVIATMCADNAQIELYRGERKEYFF